MNNPLFSILVANYDNGHFFKDCYLSIISQTYVNWEVVIVDDGSTDNSIELIKQIIEDDNRFKLFINHENKGCGYTKNRCATLAKGEILGFLDPDNALMSNALEVMVESHLLNAKVSIVTSKYELVDLEMNFISWGNHGKEIPAGKSYLTYGKGALTHFATFKRTNYLQSDGIDVTMKRAVDQDLYYKMEEQGKHLFVGEILYRYRIHQNSISHNENLYKAQYWHFYAINRAYKRRKVNIGQIDNLSSQYMRMLRSNYYLSRFEKTKSENKVWSKYYFLIKSLLAYPRHKLKYKLKSIIQ